jgi:putative ABC transport system substrate-binding protein
LAAKRTTATIPIVAGAVGAPVECGLVGSLARPGGNVTGTSWHEAALTGKLVEIAKDLLPRLSRISVLWNPDNCADAPALRALQEAARVHKVQIQPLAARTPEDVERAFPIPSGGRRDALVVMGGPPNYWQRRVIADLAKQQRLPVVATLRQFAEEGALASYGANPAALMRRAAIHVDKILKGARPGDLPMERPDKFELIVNLKTAKALGLTIPQSVLVRADEVIQ